MILKAFYRDGIAIIRDDKDHDVFSFECENEDKARDMCLNDRETRASLMNLLSVHKISIDWVSTEQEKKEEPVKEEPATQDSQSEYVIRDCEVKKTRFEEKINGMIFDLEQSDEKIEIEKNNHRATMQDLTKEQENIKSRLYEARKGKIMEPVKCRLVMDYNAGIKQIVREDTGEIVESMDITAEEMQMNAFQEKESPPVAKKRNRKAAKSE